MSKIRNFHFANQEAPIFGIITKSQLMIVLGVGAVPFIWLFYNIKIGTNPLLTIISSIVFILSILGAFFITSYKIDGRTIIKYLADKRRIKVKKKSSRSKIPPTNIDELIDKIVK